MKFLKHLCCTAILLVCVVSVFAQTSEFTYQGKISDSGTPAATYDFQFRLFDAETGGVQIGAMQQRLGVPVSLGVFAVKLDLGAGAFDGANRWLEISLKRPSDGTFTTLSPRQPVNSAPYSIKSRSADTASDAAQLGGVPAAGYLRTNGDGSGLTNLNGANIINNTINASALASDTFPNNQNLSRLGSLRWDLLAQRVSVGALPRGVAFDGTNIWVANSGSNNVTKLRASDGAVQGTFAVGGQPFSVAFDGTNIWVASLNNSVSKVRASDGMVLGTFSVPGVSGVAFDGSNIWAVSFSTNVVTKLRASDGANLGSFPVGGNPQAAAFDGANIWVTNNTSNNVTKLRASDGAVLGTIPVGTGPQGIAFDGANIWVTNNSSGNVTKLRASDGFLLGTFPAGSNPLGVAFDGTSIWIANTLPGTVTKLRASDGALQETFVVGPFPQRIAFDGANVWVTSRDGNSVHKLAVFH